MKKTVRFLSVVMVIVMMFSMTTSSFAMMKGSGSSGSVVIGGSTTTSGSSSSSGLVIGGDARPSDSTPYGGYNTGTNTGLETTDEEQYAKTYAGTGDYSDIEESTDVNVQLNEDFLKFVRDNWQDTSLVSPETLAFAIGFWGEELVKGTGIVEGAETTTTTTATTTTTETAVTEETTETTQEQSTIIIGATTPAPVIPAESETESEEENAAEETQTEETQTEETQTEETRTEETVTEQTESTQAEETPAEAQAAEAASEETPAETSSDAEPVQQSAKKNVIHAEAISYAAPGTWVTNVNGTTLSSQLTGGKLTMSKPFDICNSTDYRVTIDLNGTTITYTGSGAAFVINGEGAYGSSISFTNGTINGDAFYVTNNGVLNLGGWINISGLDITVNPNENAIYVDNGGTVVVAQGTTLNAPNAGSGNVYIADAASSLKMTGGYIFGVGGIPAVNNNGYFLLNGSGADVNSSYANVNNDSGIAVQNAGTMDLYAGTVKGTTGIYTTAGSVSMYNGTVTGMGNRNTATSPSWYYGAAIAVSPVQIGGSPSGAPTVTVSGGALRSEYYAAIVASEDGTSRMNSSKRTEITNITLSAEKLITQQADKSDYQVALFTVNGVGCKDLNAVYAAITASSASTITVKMGDDYEIDDYVNFNFAGKNIVFEGNAFELKTKGVVISAGNVTIQNVILYGQNTGYGVCVSGSSTVAYIGSEVTVKRFKEAIRTENGTVTVNDVNVTESCDVGVSAVDGITTVIMIKDDAETPVWSDSTAKLIVRGGWFLYEIQKGTSDVNTKVATYVDAKTSNVKYIEADKYYEVLYNTDPTVEIVSGETGYYNDTPYVIYDKGDATPIIFNVNPEVLTIKAVAKKAAKASYVLYSTEGNGVSGNIRLADNEVLMDCPAGAYDLQFTFANGYVIKEKLSLYIYPKYLKIFEVPNTFNMATLKTDDLKEYLTSDYEVDTYNVADGNNFAIVMSELPDKLAIGSDSNGVDVIYLENFDPSNPSTYSVLPSGVPYAGNYVYFLSYADLNNLAAGQNYCFMVFDDIKDDSGDGAVEFFPFTITNSSVYITPTTVEWTSVSGTYLNFTIKPDVLNENSVYIDGEKVDSAYWTYDEDTYVLSLKSSYVNALEKTGHTLEVITSMGKVSATVNTKIGLMAKNLDYHVYGGAKSLSFVASDTINKDAGIWIGASNPTQLDSSCYVWDSETGFTLSAAFLNRLSLGTYYVSCYVWNGTEYEYSTTSFKVISASQASYNPSTGDNSNIFIWLIVLALSAVAIVIIVLPRFKKKAAGEAGEKKKSSHLK